MEELRSALYHAEVEKVRMENELDVLVNKISMLSAAIHNIEDATRHAPMKTTFVKAQTTADIDAITNALCDALAFVTNRKLVYQREELPNGSIYRKIVRINGEPGTAPSIMCHVKSDGSVCRGVPWQLCEAECNAFTVDYGTLRKKAYVLTWE